jgi:hypothetical protein
VFLENLKKKNGGGELMLHEPRVNISYLSIFITHFLSNPSANSGILRKLYIENSLSTYQIEEITDSMWSKSAIGDALKKNLISRDRLASRPQYGEKFVGGKRVPHLAGVVRKGRFRGNRVFFLLKFSIIGDYVYGENGFYTSNSS